MGNKRRPRFTQQDDLEDMNSFLTSQNHFLKKNNEDLAKSSADTKMEYQKLMQQKTEIERRLYFTNFEKLKYRESLKVMGVELQAHVQQCLMLTEQMSNTLTRVQTVLHSDAMTHIVQSPHTPLQSISTGNEQLKTVAVMPMISGHTILSPKINLPRVTVQQLTDMMNSIHNRSSEDNIEENEMNFHENNLSNHDEEEQDSNSESSDPPVNRRLLDTMPEEDEDEEEETIHTSPVVSGVFRDLKVYISPLNRKHFIKLKSKSPLRKKGSVRKTRGLSMASPKTNCSASTTTYEDSDESSAQTNDVDISKQAHIWSEKSNLSSNTPTMTDGGEPDPLEGPSHLWNSTQDQNSTMKSTPNETSTPRSAVAPPLLRKRTEYQSKTPTRSSNFVTKRRSFSSKNVSVMSNCSVTLQQLSPNSIQSYTTGYSRRSSGGKRTDSPTVLERSRSSAQSSTKKKKRKTKESVSSVSPKKRGKRTTKQITYKEPSLNKKLRRN